MWREVIQGVPASYSSSLVALYYLQMDTPTVELALKCRRNSGYSLTPTSHHPTFRESPRDRTSPTPVRGKGCPKNRPRKELWFFLREHGDDMRKWDGEPTSKLSAWVHELRGKRPGKKGLPKKTVSVVAPERPEDTQHSPRYEKTKTISYNPDEGTSDLASRRSDSEYSDQEQEWRVPAFGQEEEERDDRVYWTVWIR